MMIMNRNNKNNGYDVSKDMLETIRSMSSPKRVLREDSSSKKDAIAITNDPRFGTNVLQSQIDSFRSAVYPGAKFADQDTENPENNPLVYFPKTGNLIFSGSIPSLANLKFQISLNDATAAPYIFVDGLALTPQVCEVIKRLAGFTTNFIEQWSAAGDLLDKLGSEED